MPDVVKVLLLKVPDSVHHSVCAGLDDTEVDRYTFRPSYALASLAAFLKKYLKGDYRLDVEDVNTLAIQHGHEAIELFSKRLEHVLMQSEYDILLLSCQYMYNQRWMLEAQEIAKRSHPDCRVIAGGGYATIFPEKALADPRCDYVVIGEGEHTAVHLINAIRGLVDPDFEALFPFDGYGEKAADGTLRIVPKRAFIGDLSLLPPPDWSWMDFAAYAVHSAWPYLPVMATRGCPNQCTYCSTNIYWGRKFRFRSPRAVVDEIQSSYDAYGVCLYHFIDDNPVFNKQWFLEFAGLVMGLSKQITITYLNFSVKTLDDEVLEALLAMGVDKISLALETATPGIQKQIRKRLDLDAARETVALIRAKGMRVHTCWMIGFPGERLDDIERTIDFARELRSDSVQMYPVFPYPGTPMYDDARAAGLVNLDEDDYDSMRYRVPGKILSGEWDGKKLSRIAFDAAVEFNFLSNPAYDSLEGKTALLTETKRLLQKLPRHVIAYIVIGYLSKDVLGDEGEAERHYRQAYDLLLDEQGAFKRHLAARHPALEDFRTWLRGHDLVL